MSIGNRPSQLKKVLCNSLSEGTFGTSPVNAQEVVTHVRIPNNRRMLANPFGRGSKDVPGNDSKGMHTSPPRQTTTPRFAVNELFPSKLHCVTNPLQPCLYLNNLYLDAFRMEQNRRGQPK
ncbi:hypothetical protein CEXT_85471 [Caerostris extrusa]|uniref:Uncharacterized protein n=1 Tax=Caerostris extrusa TaxID=172846 RepID=A0AAV4REX3_CAEEX|nr:hypothetical protein CEXT_85471 [Caerostris extrusa]